MVKLDKETVLTPTIILKLVNQHRFNELPRLQKLKRYYNAKHDILNRVAVDTTQPNNKIVNNYPGYITDTLVGYFVGEPIVYNCDDEVVLERINNIFEYNDEADENTELAKDASIYGVAYEQLYMDEDSQLRFYHLPVEECVPVYDTSIESNLLYFIRYYVEYNIESDSQNWIIEVIDADKITTFRSDWTMGILNEIDSVKHYFGMVPIAIFKNNEEEIGDFEKVISLIDAYDAMESDNLNDFEYFTDAYLALYGYTAESEDVAEMKKNRVLLMDEGTKAEWLVKDLSGGGNETMKNRIDADIHKFSFCPNMGDKEFASNASGVAIKFKTMGTENLVSIKERKFKKGLQMRLELLAGIEGLLGGDFDWRDIDIIFTRNIPTNDSDLANMVNALRDLVSDETLLAQLPFIDDVQAEVERLKKQRDENKTENPFLQSDYLTLAMSKNNKQEENTSDEREIEES